MLLQFSCRSHFIDIRDGASRASARNLPPPEFSPPYGSSRTKIQAAAGPPLRSVLTVQPSFPIAFHLRDESQSTGEIIMQQLAKYLAATGRRLRILGNVICHFFRKGKLGLKIVIKIPFFVDIEFSFETDWNRR